jgi:hypothetical protein
MMYRLGLSLVLRGGREALARLLVTAAAVAIGVAIMLAALADLHAFNTTNNRPSWESTQGLQLTARYASAARAELWDYSNDVYAGQTIERLDVAALSGGAPVPPGVSALPAAGQYYASPALAALIRSAPADELRDRFPGTLAGTIGQKALAGPDELVIYIGRSPGQLAGLPGTRLVTSIATAPGSPPTTPFFRAAFIAGTIAFLFPILILIGTATRLAAARREERYAAMRLVGATSRQVGVISSVDAVGSALLGALAGVGIFLLLQPALADSAITSARYFADYVTPTPAGYLLVLIGVPLASAISSLLSLQRVRISPLGVARRATPGTPTPWRLAPLVIGMALVIQGVIATSKHGISYSLLLGPIIILIGLVVAGPWLTVRLAGLTRRVLAGAAPLLASRRLADNPNAAFRSIRGLVLAVFLGTMLAGALPTIDAVTATPASTALHNVLLDGFAAAPVCGNDANCTGNDEPLNPLAAPAAQLNDIAQNGLPPQQAAPLLGGLHGISGATTIPIYSLSEAVLGGAVHVQGGVKALRNDLFLGGPFGPRANTSGIVSCAGLRVLSVLGQCAPGRQAIVVSDWTLYSDNPSDSTRPIVGSQFPGVTGAPNLAVTGDLGSLYLQAVLVKVNSPATLERVRTYLATHVTMSASGSAPRTFGEEVQARAVVTVTLQRLVSIAVTLTLVVAGCSLAVAIGGSLIERKRPFTLLRVTGTATGTLYRVVLLEATIPLVAATVAAAALGYGIAALTVGRLSPAGTPVPVPDGAYFASMAAGLAGSLLAILASLPLLSRMTGPATARFE